ncbi:hypothetical protein [Pseudomonas aeruginosa]|uniref:hypothetical protein n=1 Tax=Pseudomonas aeruginosa TaxID=287 RepID=UPI001CA54C0C|nr:hypothetical protein [Pseudomonas aeruginosa]MBW6070884.1 hypothetical protein [Pseudomonas aeruginosa]USL86559.1 hypothetical protein CDGHABPJ_00095 [Pseudomonas phage OMKO1]WNV48006.1 hypothetical protein [Pseudomonas phage fMGyn-Pae01]
MARRSNTIRIGFNIVGGAGLPIHHNDVFKLRENIMTCFGPGAGHYVYINADIDKQNSPMALDYIDAVVYVDLNTARQAERFKKIDDLVNHLKVNLNATNIVVDASEYIQPSHMSYIEDGYLNMFARREGKEVIKTLFTDEYGAKPLSNMAFTLDMVSDTDISGIYLIGEENRANKLTNIISTSIRTGNFNFRTMCAIRDFYNKQYSWQSALIAKAWAYNGFYVDVLVKFTNGKVISFAKNDFVGGPTELEFHYFGVDGRENWDNASDRFVHQVFEKTYSVKL